MEQLLVVPGIFVTLLFLAWPSAAQRVPPVACPQYFEYLSFNQEYVGRISVRHDPEYQENTLSVQFSQRSRLNSVCKNMILMFVFGFSLVYLLYTLITH